MENRFLQNSCKYKKMILKQFWSILYMDRIQYILKILYLYFWHEIQYRLNWKPKTNKLKTFVCVNLSISTLSNLYTRFKHTKLNKPRSSCRTPSPSRLDPNAIHRAWLQPSAKCYLDTQALESTHVSLKTSLLKLNTY